MPGPRRKQGAEASAAGPAARRLLAVAWQRPGTGMTRVADRLLSSLDGWSIDLVGVGYAGPVQNSGSITLHPSTPGGRDTFGAHAAATLLEEGPPPDAVLVHNDLWLLPRYARTLAPALAAAAARTPTGRIPLLAYLPLDGEVGSLPCEALEALLAYDGIAVYTEWARQGLAAALRACGEAHGPQLARVGHGVDLARFQPAAPLADPVALARARAALKQRLFPDLNDPAHTLLVLNANRPDVRKRVDLSLEGFADLLGRMPGADVRLVLHHAHTTGDVSASLRAHADRLGIRSKVIFDPLGQESVVEDASLAELMAACEIGLNTSIGEGWGLLAFEHAATGGAQVLGRHSAHTELWEGAAILVEPAVRRVPQSSPLEMAELDPRSVGQALETLCSDPATCHQVSVRCQRRATERRFTWAVAAAAFGHFLDNAIAHG